MEPDEGRMRKAAHLMVSSLSGSLAIVTCREMLRHNIDNQLRHLLQPNNLLTPDQLNQTVAVRSVIPPDGCP